MVASLLCYNTLDGLFCTHPPVQLDGNFGIAAPVASFSGKELAPVKAAVRTLRSKLKKV